MIKVIIEHFARRYYEIRCKEELSGSQTSDYEFAERTIGRILAGDEPLCKHDFMFLKEDYAFLEQEIKEIHGRCYSVHHDVMHYCAKINDLLDDGSIRPAQELLAALAEKARVGMIVEIKHGQ